jgi:Zn-dependent peptidase ImmA (M78 family)
MNTTEKGDVFENICFEILSKFVDEGKLGVIPNNCKIFKRKGYFSRDRDDLIIFDLSIEVWLQDAPNYSCLYIFECKNYSSRVPVNDIEEFYTKVNQVAGLNAKGIFITNNSFQSGAYKFARAKGMMLIEVNNNITFNIILHKIDRNKQLQTESNAIYDDNNDKELTSQHITLRQAKRLFEKGVIQLFLEYNRTLIQSNKKINYPILSASDIEEMVEEILKSYDLNSIHNGRPLNWDKFKIFLFETFELQIDENQAINVNGLLGYCSFMEKKIAIDIALIGTKRYSFILAHEVGHFFLHNKLSISQASYEGFKDSEYDFGTDRFFLDSRNPKNWIEWQANKFASCLIMPKLSFLKRLGVEQEKQNINPGRKVYLDEQRCNRITFNFIVQNLSLYFNTSQTSVIFRLDSLGLLNINFRTKTTGQIINEFYPHFLE